MLRPVMTPGLAGFRLGLAFHLHGRAALLHFFVPFGALLFASFGIFFASFAPLLKLGFHFCAALRIFLAPCFPAFLHFLALLRVVLAPHSPRSLVRRLCRILGVSQAGEHEKQKRRGDESSERGNGRGSRRSVAGHSEPGMFLEPDHDETFQQVMNTPPRLATACLESISAGR